MWTVILQHSKCKAPSTWEHKTENSASHHAYELAKLHDVWIDHNIAEKTITLETYEMDVPRVE